MKIQQNQIQKVFSLGPKGTKHIDHIHYLRLGPTLPSKLVSFPGNCKHIKLKFTSDARSGQEFSGKGD